MTRKSKRDIERELAEVEESAGGGVFEELWKRSAGGEEWREDEEFVARLRATVEKEGWPANPWRET